MNPQYSSDILLQQMSSPPVVGDYKVGNYLDRAENQQNGYFTRAFDQNKLSMPADEDSLIFRQAQAAAEHAKIISLAKERSGKSSFIDGINKFNPVAFINASKKDDEDANRYLDTHQLHPAYRESNFTRAPPHSQQSFGSSRGDSFRQAQPPQADRRAEEERQQLEDQKRYIREDQAKKEAERDAKPENAFSGILTDFQHATQTAQLKVSQLRRQRTSMTENFTVAEKCKRLACHFISQVEAQQATAVEQEDFDLAERFAAVIQKYELEKEKQQTILDHITRALSALNTQHEAASQEISRCFSTLREKLARFQLEQDSAEKEDQSEVLNKFQATAKRLSTETARLNRELKSIERLERFGRSESKELETLMSAESGETEAQYAEARTKLTTVKTEIESLRAQLAKKEAMIAYLTRDMNSYDHSLAKVRDKYSRQLASAKKKEAQFHKARTEYEIESKLLLSMKHSHEVEVQAHSDSLLSYEKMVASVKKEIAVAGKLEQAVRNEIADENFGNPEKENELGVIQDELVKSEAAVAEAKQLAASSVAVIQSLQDEIKDIESRVPVLEVEMKMAASKRDFKGAGRASKEIKYLATRQNRCEEDVVRLGSAKDDLETLEFELATKKAYLHEKEKEKSTESMIQLAKKIVKLKGMKHDLCSNVDADGTPFVASVGAAVLDNEIEVLCKKGKRIDEEFGGWDHILKAAADSHAFNSVEELVSELDKTPIINELENDHHNGVSEKVDKEIDVPVIDPEQIKELEQKLKEAEVALEAVVKNEDYEEAGELEEEIDSIKAKLAEMGVSDDASDEQLEKKVFLDDDDE